MQMRGMVESGQRTCVSSSMQWWHPVVLSLIPGVASCDVLSNLSWEVPAHCLSVHAQTSELILIPSPGFLQGISSFSGLLEEPRIGLLLLTIRIRPDKPYLTVWAQEMLLPTKIKLETIIYKQTLSTQNMKRQS